MTQGVKHWLPEQAFTADAVRAVLGAVVEAWCQAWIADKARVSLVLGQGHVSAPEANVFRHRSAIAAAELPSIGKRHLLEAMLCADLMPKCLGSGDHKVLDALARRAVEDLTARLDKAFAPGDTSTGNPDLALTLFLAERECLTMAVSRHALVPALRQQFGTAKPAASIPQSRARALGPTRLTLDGVLGCAELTVQDLEELSVGDVIVLDRRLNEPVALRLAGNPSPVALGKLIRNGTQHSVQL